MAFTIAFSNISSKLPNSTKKYNVDSTNFPYTFSVVLKDNSSSIHPVIQLDRYINANYAYISEFNRYYFIRDIVQINNALWEYYLDIDAMGTYSDNIKASTQYCERSSAGDEAIYDNLVSRKNRVPTTVTNIQPIQGITTSGYYVLETAGPGGIKLYAIGEQQLTDLITSIFTPNSYDGSFSTDNIKSTFNPFKYILSCRWFPINLYNATDLPIGGTVTAVNIPFGWWTAPQGTGTVMPQPGSAVYDAVTGENKSSLSALITVPTIDNTGAFYNTDENWITHNLYIPGCGDIPIPAQFSGTTLRVSIYIDYYTGQCNFEVFGGNPLVVISRGTGRMGIDIRLADMTPDMGNMGTTIMRSITDINPSLVNRLARQPDKVQGPGDIGTAIINAFNAVLPGNGLQGALSPNLTLTTATGNVYYLIQRPNLEITTKYISPYNFNDVHSKFNYPDNTYISLSMLSGYTRCISPKLDIACTSEEKAIIYKYMQEGFYIE